MANITSDEVRYRLRSLNNSLVITDAMLNSVAYIPACESFVNVALANSSYSFSSLSADKQNLIKAAEIAKVCQKVVSDAPLEDFKVGPIDGKGISAADKQKMVDLLEKEMSDYLQMAGVFIYDTYASINDGSDYMPDGTDETNLLMTDDEYQTHSVWP